MDTVNTTDALVPKLGFGTATALSASVAIAARAFIDSIAQIRSDE